MAEVALELSVRDLVHADLESCGWSGSDLHLANVAQQLVRARRGEVDYLAVCTPVGLPVAKAGVDYRAKEGAGTIWQLSVHPALQSRGIGTLLIGAAEQRIRSRGLRHAELGVEEDNPRARALYERLGYVAYDRQPDAWDERAPDGSLRRYETMCTLMRKELPPEPGGRPPGRTTG
ncbi:GNAT family N-acetyltransferase [Streptomyces sp. CB01881]|uniref:GNAT family N-acetyltransferase n=1 Tax=Streptomyces sp. CB01881 TaxID=2078691 RepID=UPI000CDCBC97|nr:GNAT family N-acetyltransferase [Streptomyces sp. CB01881]AUY49390.1 GNAT family N-acetyltransferase [Streptomyces sp. CB01881]TYC72779.1 GNAT family N-acetyltransferase [Streptomyces sp. CB01881]